jgi:hypothetical protein
MNTWILDTAIARLLSTNAVVLTEPPNSQIVGKPETASDVQTNLPKDGSHPGSAIFSDKRNAAPPLDLYSWILLVPLVSHVSECSTIRIAFALPRRDDNGAETSTRLAKKAKRSRRNLGIVLPHYSTIGWQTGGKQNLYRLGPTPSRRKQCIGRGRMTPCSYQPGRCATRTDLWRLGSALRRTGVG